GKLLAKLEVPHIAAVLKDNAKLRESAEEALKAQTQSYEATMKQFADQIKTLQEQGKERLAKEQAKADANKTDEAQKKSDGLSEEERTQLQALEFSLKNYQEAIKEMGSQNIEKVMAE